MLLFLVLVIQSAMSSTQHWAAAAMLLSSRGGRTPLLSDSIARSQLRRYGARGVSRRSTSREQRVNRAMDRAIQRRMHRATARAEAKASEEAQANAKENNFELALLNTKNPASDREHHIDILVERTESCPVCRTQNLEMFIINFRCH